MPVSGEEVVSKERPLKYKDRVILPRVAGKSLDVGCGKYKLGDIGIDVEQHGTADFIVDIGEEYPFDDASFDTVICSEVLEHLDDPGFVLDEIRRVLRPEGKLIVSVPNSGNPLFRAGLWKQKTTCGPPHQNFWTEEEFVRFLRESGWEVVWRKRSWYKKKLWLRTLATCLVFEAVPIEQ